MPWKVLRKGPKPAKDTILLDYVSQWNVIALFKSIAARHAAVTLAILCSLLIKGLIVLSTGLLALQTTATNQPVRLTPTNRFDPSMALNITTGDPGPAMGVTGMLWAGLDPARGTTTEAVMQSFNLSSTLNVTGKSTPFYFFFRQLSEVAWIPIVLLIAFHNGPC